MAGQHWHEYWASGGSSENALADPVQRAFLAQHWHSVFSEHASSGMTIVDIACGDGAIFDFVGALVPQMGRVSTLIALDASEAGVRGAMRATPNVSGAASDARFLPLRDGAVDLVVSQFGLEYAGIPAFAEAARVVKSSGRLSAICHIKSGAISAECAINCALLDAFAAEDVCALARQSLSATYERGASPMSQEEITLEGSFADALQRAGYLIARSRDCNAKSLLARALREIAGVASRRLSYDPPTAMAFIEQVEQSLAAYTGRMRSMLDVALGNEDMYAVADIFRSQNLVDFSAVPISFRKGAAPSAWLMKARRA